VENYDKEFQNLQLQLISLGTEKFNGVNLFSTNSTGSAFTVPTSEDGSQNTSVTKASMDSDPAVSMMVKGFIQVGGGSNPAFMPKDDTKGVVYFLDGSTGDSVEFDTVTGERFSTIYSDIDSFGTNSLYVTGAEASYGFSDNSSLSYDNSAAFAYISQMALQNVADMRAQNGAEMSRVNFAQDLLNINAINLEAANSRIIDVDVAAESSQLARFQILQQAGTAMLAQANTSQQSLVRLLQG
jgi:flagellin-like hook-associated protein FlgL